MENLTFNGKTVIRPIAPIMKKSQVWQSESGKLIRIISVFKEKGETLSAICENEDGSKFSMGAGWFNNREYTYLGYTY